MKNKTIRMILGISFNLILVIAGVYFIAMAGSKTYTFGHNIFNEESITTEANANEVDVVVTAAQSDKQIAKMLADKGLVKDQTICYFQIILSDYKGKFVAGDYTLNTGMKPTEMFATMAQMTEEDAEE